MVVFTADHGDYLGDHWLGDKDLLSRRLRQGAADRLTIRRADDAVRGAVADALVEAIDLVPTFLDALGGDPDRQSHRLEGCSLLPLLQGRAAGQRTRIRHQRIRLFDAARWPPSSGSRRAMPRLFMIADWRWKLIHAVGFPPLLFDLETDPKELIDRGADPACAAERQRLDAALAQWGLRQSQRTTRSEQQIVAMRGKSTRRGILIGVWHEADIPAELWSGYVRPKS